MIVGCGHTGTDSPVWSGLVWSPLLVGLHRRHLGLHLGRLGLHLSLIFCHQNLVARRQCLVHHLHSRNQ